MKKYCILFISLAKGFNHTRFLQRSIPHNIYLPMKFHLLCFIAAGLFALTSCQLEQEVTPVSETPPATIDRCSSEGIVRANDCGNYIELNDNQRIYAESAYLNNSKAGDLVEVGYTDLMSTSGGGSCGGGCGCGGGSSQNGGSQSTASTRRSCMSAEGVVEVTLTCIRIEPAPNR